MHGQVYWLLSGGSAFGCQLTGTGFYQERPIRENNGWNAAHASIHLQDRVRSLFILVNVDVIVGNPLLVEPAFRQTAVATPGRRIEFDTNWLPCGKTRVALHHLLLSRTRASVGDRSISTIPPLCCVVLSITRTRGTVL